MEHIHIDVKAADVADDDGGRGAKAAGNIGVEAEALKECSRRRRTWRIRMGTRFAS